MPRYHVHIQATDEMWETCDPMISITVDAHDDQMAELNARALMRDDIDWDVQEIELVEESAHA